MSPPWIRCQCVPRGGEYSATVPSPKIPLLTSKKDPYYSHEDTAKLCARFVTHLFACPGPPPLSKTVTHSPSPPLANFIAYALHRTRLHTSVTFVALGMSALREINHMEREMCSYLEWQLGIRTEGPPWL